MGAGIAQVRQFAHPGAFLNKLEENQPMLRNPRLRFLTFALVGSVTCLVVAVKAASFDSGQRKYGQVTVEPAINSANGDTVYLHTPDKSPFPSKANPVAWAPLYLPLYPLTSTVPAYELNCQPTNCDHANVLPFPSTDYGALRGTDRACVDFNGGVPCSPVIGHDHLVGVASSGGDFNVAWHVKLVVFTHAAFLDGKINTRITTLDQINGLVASGDVMVVDTPITFNCSITSARTYEMGTPVVIPYP
jgi:hypothetical protein